MGPQHQAGSDSLLTLNCYFRLRKILGDLHFEERANCIFGIAAEQPKPPAYHLSFQQSYQMGLYGYLGFSSTYQSPYPHSHSGFQKQWPH